MTLRKPDYVAAVTQCAPDDTSPWVFDVRCMRCGTVFPNWEPWCPTCEEEFDNTPAEVD